LRRTASGRMIGPMPESRYQIDPSTQLPSIQSVGELSRFLRSAMADEESMQFGESMGELARQVEEAATQLRAVSGAVDAAGLLIGLLTTLREHHAMVVGLDKSWRGLYEYAAYLGAINNFRVLVAQWLREGVDDGHAPAGLADLELVAWRALGEGVLLLDMHEQWRDQAPPEPESLPPDEHRVVRARSWWEKLRG
jgi:hypothetical protein